MFNTRTLFSLVLASCLLAKSFAQTPPAAEDAPPINPPPVNADTTPVALPQRLSSLTNAEAALTDLVRERVTLDDAITRALAKNFAIKRSSFDVSIAQGAVTEQYGIFDPKFAGSYGYNEGLSPQLADPITGVRPPATERVTDDYNFGLGGVLPWGMTYSLSASNTNDRGTLNGFIDNYASFAGVSGRQPLLRDFGFGATTAQIRIAMTNRSISEWQYKRQVMITITDVTSAYYNLNFAYAILRSALRSRDLAAQLVTENEKRYKVGSMSEYDVTTARSSLVSREDGILQARQFVLSSENALKALISDDRSPKLLAWHLEIDPLPTAVANPVDAASDFQIALKKRPDYQQAQLAVKRGDINYRFQKNQLLPRLDLVGSYGYSGYDLSNDVSRRMVRDEDYRAFSYGVQVTVPLTFTAERGRLRSAKYQFRQAQSDLERLEQQIVVAVGNSASDIETAFRRVESTTEARKLAQATLDAELKRLRTGFGSTRFVLQQQDILGQAENAEANAKADYQRALADYDLQLGLTLEKRNVTLTPPE